MDMKKVAIGLANLTVLAGVTGGILYLAKKALDSEKKVNNRLSGYYSVVRQWLEDKNDGKNVGEYFEQNDYKTIAIYGMGSLGQMFYDELKKTNPNVKVAYFIDMKADELYYGLDDIPVVNLDKIEEQEEVDAIVVTPVHEFNKISDELAELELPTEIISLEDIVYEI